jgi:hypothetical protein
MRGMLEGKQGIFRDVDCAPNSNATLSPRNSFGLNWSEWRAVA